MDHHSKTSEVPSGNCSVSHTRFMLRPAFVRSTIPTPICFRGAQIIQRYIFYEVDKHPPLIIRTNCNDLRGSYHLAANQIEL